MSWMIVLVYMQHPGIPDGTRGAPTAYFETEADGIARAQVLTTFYRGAGGGTMPELQHDYFECVPVPVRR